MSKVTIQYKGHSVDCYGDMHEQQNVSIVCDDELYDGILPMGFNNWTDAVHFIIDKTGRINPVELEAV
ncbi:MAG: hypothetical protein KAI17_10960 [Thiotrichaceae bacterium]|nr:hypothetical protein [Thiotrichaceae bacterium]